MDLKANKTRDKSNNPGKIINKSSIVKRILLHDIGNFFAEGLFENLQQDIQLIQADSSVAPCKGCFSCWIKTPGRCIIEDEAQALPSLIKECKELIIVSRVIYGGFSPNIKAYVDRMIPCLLPYFEIKKGKMRHPYRYKNKLKLTLIFYSETSSGDFLLQGQENRTLHDFAEEQMNSNLKKEAKVMNRMRPVFRNGVDDASEWINEKKIMDSFAESISKNLGVRKYECQYVGDIVNIKEVKF